MVRMPQRPTFIAPFFVFACIAVMLSCGGQFAFESKKDIPNAKWNYSDTLDFAIPISDTSKLYDLYVEFSHADTFPNQNIYLKIYTRFPDGKRMQRVRSFDLFDTEGKPLGKQSGGGFNTRILLQNNLYFNQLGEHLITLEQFTRSNPLEGIMAVSLKMEEKKEKCLYLK